MAMIRRHDPFRRFARSSGLLALALGLAVIASAQPCPDDLLVETGHSRDVCGPAAPADEAPSDSSSTTSVCPCACHMSVVVLAAPVGHPLLLEVEAADGPARVPTDYPSSPETPPPRG